MRYSFQSCCRRAVADFFLYLLSSYRLFVACVVVAKCKILGNVMSADCIQPGWSGGGIVSSGDGAINAVRGTCLVRCVEKRWETLVLMLV